MLKTLEAVKPQEEKKNPSRDIFNLSTLKGNKNGTGTVKARNSSLNKISYSKLAVLFFYYLTSEIQFFCIGLKKLWVNSIPHFLLPDTQTKLILEMQTSQNHRMVWVRKDLEEHHYLKRLLWKKRSLQAILTGFRSFTPIEAGLENSGVHSLEGRAAILVGIFSFLLWKFHGKIEAALHIKQSILKI